MKKRYILVPLCIVVIFSLLMLPCSALVSDVEDTLVLDRVFYNSNSSSSNLKELFSMTLSQGLTDEDNRAMHITTKTPNYFVEQFQIYSSSGLPIMDKRTYEFSLQGLVNRIEIDDDTDVSGIYNVKTLRERSVKVYYTDGTSTTYSPDGFSSFSFYPTGDSYTYSFSFSLNATKEVKQINIRLFYSLIDYGIPYLDGSEDLFDWIYYLGSEDFRITRDETYLTASNGIVNDAHDREQGLLNDSFSDFQQFIYNFDTTQNLLRPSTSASLDQGGIYKGALFIGNLMKSVVEEMPFLNNLLTISLSVGVFTIVLGLAAEAFSPRHVKSSNPKKERKRKVKDKNKGSA